MPKKLNLLFIGAGRRVSLAERFLEAAKEIDVELKIFSYEIQEDVPIANTSEVIVGKRWKDEGIEEHLVRIFNEFNINIAIPMMDEATVVLSRMKEKLNFNKKTLLLVSKHELCHNLFNKRASSAWFNKLDILTPEKHENVFPKIIKGIYGFGSRDNMTINNQSELDLFFSGKNRGEYIIQPFIRGTEYTVDSYVGLDGCIKAIVPRIRVEVRSGEVSVSVTNKNEKVIELTRKILGISAFVGPICLQFIEEKVTKNLYIIEVNPRFGGGVINSIEAGANMPLYILKEYFNERIAPLSYFVNNLKMMRADREIFVCK